MKKVNRFRICSLVLMGIFLMNACNSVKEELKINPNSTNGPVTDIDGNVYHSVKIGTQIWMDQNLNTTRYRNGDLIPNVTDLKTWQNLKTGAYCDYKNLEVMSVMYGRLYNWYAANDSRNIAPIGWHVATVADWITLETYLGLTTSVNKIKETGNSHWINPQTNATNETGFTALPGGGLVSLSGFYSIGLFCGWWPSTDEYNSYDYARSRFIDNTTISIGYSNEDKHDGLSVRCVKDN